MSNGDCTTPEPHPSRQTLDRVAAKMSLVRELTLTPRVGNRRVQKLLTSISTFYRATAAVATMEIDSTAEPIQLAAVRWTSAAGLARGRHRLGVRTGELLVDVLPLAGRRRARLELLRSDADPFTDAEAAWVSMTHAACVWVYGDDVEKRSPVTRASERLSPRDRETLDHLLNGASEKEIAARVGRSPHTIHTRVKRIYRRLGVTSRPELLARCLGDDSS